MSARFDTLLRSLTATDLRRLLPFLRWWGRVERKTLRDDLLAGLSGALIVLPQGVAFGTIAGLPPEYGLYAAMVPAVIAALFGSSWHLVSGPTTAISIALFAALSPLAEPGSERYIELALTVTFLVGLFQLALGLARLGALVNFISHTVIIGFTSGAAILIAASQAGKFFGLPIPRGASVTDVLTWITVRAADINPYVVAVGLVTLATGMITRKRWPKVPYMIVAMVVGSVVAEVLNLALGEEHTGIRTVGALASGLPPLSAPSLSWEAIRTSLPSAVVITMLALTEAVSIARSIAVRSEQRIDGNQEFIGQGLSNLAGAFFSAYASSGSFNRSGVNYEAGARTPLASVFASVFLVLVLLLVAPLAAFLPTAAMAGILFLVAWGLIDFHHIRAIWHTSKAESLILWATLFGTLVELETGILLGVLSSLIMFLHRSSKPEVTPMVPPRDPNAYHFEEADGRPECPQLRIMRVNGPAYFGAVDHIQQALQAVPPGAPLQKSLLVTCSGLNFVDVAGAEMFAQEARRRRRMGGGVYFYRLREPIHRFLRQGEYLKDIGEGVFFPIKSNATGAIYWTLDPDICRTCKVRIFKECHGERLPDGFRRQRLMLAADGSEDGAAAVDVALGLARRFGVTLDVATVVPTRAADDQQRGRQRLDPIVREGIRQDVDCEPVVRSGQDIIGEVAGAAAVADANVLVIGRRPPAGGMRERMVGDTAARIIARTHCSVLVVSPGNRLWTQRILLAADGSRLDEESLELTTQIARVSQVPVTVLSVLRDNERDPERLRAAAARLADHLRVEGVDAQALVLAGNPAQVIAAQVRELGADLVVVGNHDRHGLNRLLIDATSDQVIGAAGCPVLVVKQGEEVLSLISQEL